MTREKSKLQAPNTKQIPNNIGFKFGIFAGLLCLMLAGCARPQNDHNTLNLHLDTDPTTLDPALMTDVRSGRLSALLFDTLVQYDENLKLRPALARSWEISSDGRTFTFHLRKDVLFSNGERFNADDVIFSLERLAHPQTASPRAWILSHVEGFQEFRSKSSPQLLGIRAPDPFTLSMTLEKPFAPFLALLTMPNASIVSKKSFSKDHVLGTGPFVLDHWRHDYEILLRSNPHYFNGPAKIEWIRFRIIKETLFVSSEFRQGRLDIIEIPGTELPLYQNDPHWKGQIITQRNLSLYYLGLNCRRKPFNMAQIRQALACAIDKETLIKTLRKNRANAVTGPLPPGIQGYDQKLSSPTYDLIHANQILRKYRSQIPASLILLQSANEETLELSEAIQANLKKIGIHFKIVEQEWSAFKARLNEGDFDAFLLSWWADYPDGENFLYPLFHSSNLGIGGNYTGFKNSQVDEWIEKAQTTTSRQKRLKLYHKIQEVILDECPMVFLYNSASVLIKQPWVNHFTAHPLYHGNKLTRVEKELR